MYLRPSYITCSKVVFFFSNLSFTYSYMSSSSCLNFNSSAGKAASASSFESEFPSLAIIFMIDLMSSSLIRPVFYLSIMSKVRLSSFFGVAKPINSFIMAKSSKLREPFWVRSCSWKTLSRGIWPESRAPLNNVIHSYRANFSYSRSLSSFLAP